MILSPPFAAGLGHSELSDLQCWGRCSPTKWGEITECPEGSLITVSAPNTRPSGWWAPASPSSSSEDRSQ